MAGWQEELAELLRGLGVTQEEPKTHFRSANKPIRSDVKRQPHTEEPELSTADAFLLDDTGVGDSATWLTDLSAMRHEVDSIVQQVIQLMQRGDLDTSLKEDVMVVLKALRRRSMVTQQAAVSDEAYLESAAAMLHFCRLVLRLSETAIEDF